MAAPATERSSSPNPTPARFWPASCRCPARCCTRMRDGASGRLSGSTRLLDGLCEPCDRWPDRARAKSREAEQKPRTSRRLMVHPADCANHDTVATRRIFDRNVRDAISQISDEMHALARYLDGQVRTYATRQVCDQCVALIAVEDTHPAGMGGEMALVHETRDQGLIER